MGASPSIIKVLHIDDDPFELDRVKKALASHQLDCLFDVYSVSSSKDYLDTLKRRDIDISLLDIHIEGDSETGISLAEKTREIRPSSAVIMCSTVDDVPTVAECLSTGADDFISKQADQGELSLRMYNSWRLTSVVRGNLNQPGVRQVKGRKPIGATMTKISRRIPLIIDSAITSIYINGESGTGKEVVSDLFAAQVRAGTPFVKVNCGAISPGLLESELFGHVKGAFTGATNDKRGLFESASGGWIFLDEVATLSKSAQVALLRVLENQEIIRVGSAKATKINVRVLSATNENLAKMVDGGEFRSDLFQRLCETEIVLPPLRDRPGEIKPLIDHFCETMTGGPYEISKPAEEVLTSVSWQAGNIRELRNCLRAMTEMHVNKLLTPLAIPSRIWDELGDIKSNDSSKAATKGSSPGDRGEDWLNVPWNLGEPEPYDVMSDRLLLSMTTALFEKNGKLSLRGLAQMIGMSRSTLSGRLKGVVHKNLIELPDLAKMVGVSEK